MYKKILPSLIFMILMSCQNTSKILNGPPITPKKEIVDEYFGETIIDSYRNLENLKDSTVINWFHKQQEYSQAVLNRISKKYDLAQKLQKASSRGDYKVKSSRITSAGEYFFLKQNSGENVFMLYHKKSFDAEKEILLYDPTKYKSDLGYSYIINYIKPSWDGKKIAISLSKEGEEVSEVIVMDVATKVISPKIITNCDPSGLNGIHWLYDNSGFIYQYLPVIDINDKNFYLNTVAAYYEIGTDPKAITELFSKTNNPEIDIRSEDFPYVSGHSNQGKYIFASIAGVNVYEDTFYAKATEIKKQKFIWTPLFKKTDKIKLFVIENDEIIYLTAKGASNFQICKTSIINPDFENPEILVKEKEDRSILDFEYRKEGLFFTTLKNGVESRLFVINDSIEKEITLPIASGKSFVASYGENFYVSTQGWTSPYRLYKYDIIEETFTKANLSPSVNYEEYRDIVVKELEVSSYDGKKVPLSIIYKKSTLLNSKNPTILLGYGSYGASYTPFFSTAFLTWISEGGILAVTHVRGGGEKGDAWHKAGFKTTKKNTWKDAIACTEYMINEKYTSSNHTIIYGISAGGIMVGRAITERPDLFKVAIGVVPSINLLRSEFQVNGPNNIKEFGTIKDSIEFKALLEMDAYQHIKKGGNYPATLFLTGIKDQRVVAWDPGKFIAKLQEFNGSSKPILLKVDFNSGHGVNDSDQKYNEEMADIFSFAFWQTGHLDYQSTSK
ncbi:prolyl oligopeptidase family serine peptidase [Aquimarina sp. AU58]|uniref:prolyl oligopeptidase family serine peptidase n=1 Tax=Aquimarina sp. AU58 TaxID=1874112 RepID=UPI000D6E7BC6|nr:prolyl oligopeptidase family serine peptidase [Aquimarina sp. AU58]